MQSGKKNPYPLFDRNELMVKPLSERVHDLNLADLLPLTNPRSIKRNRKLKTIAERIISANKCEAPVILMMGGHVLRAGVQHFIIDLIEKRYISCIAMNGAGIIHDYEFSLIGATTESVSKYIKTGQFGLWKETGALNDIINSTYRENRLAGMGEAIGSAIEHSSFPFKSLSITAAAFRHSVPVTVHVGIGHDIIHEHPNCDGAATGALSYNDFLKFARVLEDLENGVVMNFGSAVMAPEVFLKALSMARNVAHQKKCNLKTFTTLVCDIVKLPSTPREEPSKNVPIYYFRPLKTMLIRTVADGGESFYVRGLHRETIPALWAHLCRLEEKYGENCRH